MSGIRALALTLLAAALLAVGCSLDDGDETAATTTSATAQAAGGERDGAPRGDLADIPETVEEVSPSVVTIFVEGSEGRGSGSGVIWDDEGRIVTNNHVVAGADSVEVAFANGTRAPAELLAADERTDLAVVDVDRDGLPAARFAQGLPRVGELAIALGSPLGLENTVSAGIVSALHRDVPSGGTTPALVDLIQTDAAISPGNSGGALVGAGGRVIGINVAYLPPQETGAVAIGFAIPAPTVRDVVRQLIEDGQVDHPYLGVQLAAAAAGDEPVVVVLLVEPGGPAADAGMRPRDIITRIGDREVTMVEQVYEALRGRKPGDRVRVVVQRGGEERELDVELGQRPAPAAGALPGEGG